MDFGGVLRVFGAFQGFTIFADPQLDPHGEMAGKDRRASKWILHDLRHELPHLLCRFVLGLPRGVGVGAEGEAGVVVPQHSGDRFHIYPVLEGCRGVNANLKL